MHRLRDEVDGILVGIGTIMADNPELTARLNGRKGKDPVRIVVDSKLRIMPQSKVFKPESEASTIIATTELAPKEKIKNLEGLGAKVLIVGSKNNRVDLRELMYELGKLEITSLLIEGGAEINASSISSGIVDKVLFFYAPKIIGGTDALGMVGGKGVEKLYDAINLKDVRVKRLEDDILVEGYVNKG